MWVMGMAAHVCLEACKKAVLLNHTSAFSSLAACTAPCAPYRHSAIASRGHTLIHTVSCCRFTQPPVVRYWLSKAFLCRIKVTMMRSVVLMKGASVAMVVATLMAHL